MTSEPSGTVAMIGRLPAIGPVTTDEAITRYLPAAKFGSIVALQVPSAPATTWATVVR